ncbi:hypothetical protein GE21DRAFT_1010265 [Neurospora crassa]|nr:hypothetical protein GE21DRAFT_1010265 [Neurospora crassa]
MGPGSRWRRCHRGGFQFIRGQDDSLWEYLNVSPTHVAVHLGRHMIPLLARYCTTSFREIGAEQCRHLLYGDYSYRHLAIHRANLLRVNTGGGGSDQGSSSILIA